MTEPDQTIGFSGFGSILMGAIFMSNRETKKECLKRRLFGLPSQHEGFVKKVKAGMILFLFEYEERKLYGVFEATSDGGSNIVPNAFCSSGKLFSAQVYFQRLWHCKPLSEDEFSDAIKENYYTPQKFNFALSGDQVLRLLSLFNSRKVYRKNNFMKESPINFRKYHGVPHPPRKGKPHLNRGQSVRLREPFLGGEESTTVRTQYSPATISPADNTQSGPLLQSQEDLSYPRNIHDSSMKGPCPPLEVPRLLRHRPATYIALSTNKESDCFPRDASSTDSDPQCCQCQSSLHSCRLCSYHSVDVAGGMVPLPDQQLPNSQLGSSFQSCSINNNMKCSSGSSTYDVYIPLSMEMPPQSTNFINQNSGSPMALNKFSVQLPYNPYPLAGRQSSGSNGQQQCGADKLQSLRGTNHFGCEIFDASLQYPPNDEHIKSANDHHLKSLFGEDHFDMVSPISLGASFDDQLISSPNEAVRAPHGALPSIEAVTNDGHSELHSDKRQRVSVFSRLSKSPNAEWMPHSKQQTISCNLDFGISLEQVVEMLAERGNYWQTVTTDSGRVCAEVPFAEPVSRINNPFVEVMPRTNVPFGQFMPKLNQPGRYMKGWGRSAEKWPGYGVNLQSDEDPALGVEGSDDNKDIVGDSGAQQFINFKRRSEVQKAGDGAVTEDSTGNISAECFPGKLKRRKLIRPSFCNDVPAVNSKGSMISSTNGVRDCDGTAASTNFQNNEFVNWDMRTVEKNEKDFCQTGAGVDVRISCRRVNDKSQIVEVPNIEEREINAGTYSLVEPGSSASNQEENNPRVGVCDVPAVGEGKNRPHDEDENAVNAADYDATAVGGKQGNEPADENSLSTAVPISLVKTESRYVKVASIEENTSTAEPEFRVELRSCVSNQEKNDSSVSVCDVSAVGFRADESGEVSVSALVPVVLVKKVEVAN